MPEPLNGADILHKVTADLEIDLCRLVAGCAYWAPKEGSCKNPVHPTVRRARPGKGEKRGKTGEGGRFDDNSYAKQALKSALKPLKFEGFAVCHIWPDTCYDERYHTVLANLVLLPSALASLTDHDRRIEQCLQYRSWELYGWHPEDTAQPQRPEGYPDNWREPIAPPPKPKKQSRGTKRTSSGSQQTLLITLIPSSEQAFKQAFLRRGEATIYVTYSDGRVEAATWRKYRLQESSNIIGNLRSRAQFRSGVWQENGITKVIVKVAGH
jgi:hypothetical protein